MTTARAEVARFGGEAHGEVSRGALRRGRRVAPPAELRRSSPQPFVAILTALVAIIWTVDRPSKGASVDVF
ncbi:hypothetical protein BD626DRAFT_578084 [Schizophyllum amplum]|uniref:Uncharacterized protein n=1 Tax=Schizophyllum amplum TaxID=97359 RepID=A0A550BS79_9AGAR|nr:hypothetical protein BD626DRAFT_578084 [Auriculariopsis ampla]